MQCSNKRKKLGADIGGKQMKIYCTQVNDFVSTGRCAENESPLTCIEAGANDSQSESTGDVQEVLSHLFEEEDGSDLQSILNHPSFDQKKISLDKIKRLVVTPTIQSIITTSQPNS